MTELEIEVPAVGNGIGKKGVDAIFTPPRQRRNDRFRVGLVAILACIALCTGVILGTRYAKPFGAFTTNSYSSLVLLSLGVIFVISGTGISITYYSTQTLENPVDSRKAYSTPDLGARPSTNLKYGLIAFVQSSIAIALYSGAADEFNSNPSMQEWIRATFPFGQLLLQRECVLIVAALMGLSIVQFLPGQALAER